ncbi:MAG: cytochrome c oxidase assembly protein [Comamonadaceae bacterium]|nr:MAG: cytochrome c oxidase assembly protein [Comamonadaceae bacterium]
MRGRVAAPVSCRRRGATNWPLRACGGTTPPWPASWCCSRCTCRLGWQAEDRHDLAAADRRGPRSVDRRLPRVEQLLRRAVRRAVARLRGRLGQLVATRPAGGLGAAPGRALRVARLAVAPARAKRCRRGASRPARRCARGNGRRAAGHGVDRLAGAGPAALRRRRTARRAAALLKEGQTMFDALVSLCLTGAAPALPQDWWLRWSLAPVPVIAVVGLGWLAQQQPAPRRGLAWAGVLLCALAWIAPLCRLGATLAAAHMLQLMVVVAAGALLAVGTQPRARWNAPHLLPAATLLHALVVWGWHVPAVYTAILGDAAAHVVAWSLLLASSWAFWRAVVLAVPVRPLPALLAVLVTMAHTGLLGALLTFAGRALYAVQAPGARAWGLEPLADQQLAGLLMWVPGGFAYFAVAVTLSLRMVRRTAAAHA